MNTAIRILGIDPGLRRTGWGVVAVKGSSLSFVAAGTVGSDSSAALADRLMQLHDGLTAVIGAHLPDEAAVEATFVNRDAGATLKLGQARGIAMLVPAQAGLPVAEYAPNQVKKTVVGAGHGAKAQIRMMVSVLLPRATFDSDDAADALAIAICHAHHRQSVQARLARGDRFLWPRLGDRRRAGRRLSGALLQPHPAGAAAGRRGGDDRH
jgi:crossover junction endodeoxyribonuclease RuvC